MILPFVSRWTVERIDQELADAKAENRRLSDRYDALLEKYHSLRVTGAVPVEPVRLPEPEEPSAIDEAINAKAGRNPGLRRYLTQWAASERQKDGVTDESLAHAILHWDDGSSDD